jgi:AraC-like DNA-binding protein
VSGPRSESAAETGGVDGDLGGAPRLTVVSDRSTVLRDEVAAHTTPHEVTQRSGTLSGRVDILNLPHCRLVFVRYGGEVVVEAPPTGDRTVATVPLGPMQVQQGRHRQATTYDEGFLLARAERTLMQPDSWAGAWVVSAEAEHLTDHRRLVLGTSSLTDRDDVVPFVVPDGDHVTVSGRNDLMAQACREAWTVHTLPDVTPAPVREAFVRAVESNLLTALVLSTARAEKPTVDTCGDVRVDVLIDWLDTNYAMPVTVAEMARVTGLSVRQLQASVQRALGTSPTELLRLTRLRHARHMLRTSTPQTTTVATVAYRCGIPHPGRFSQQYRMQYGESPSVTLARSVGS